MLSYKKSLVIVMLLLISALAGSLGAKALMSQQQSSGPGNQPETYGTIRQRVQRAKARGQQEIIVPTPVPLLAVVNDLSDALSNFTVVVVQPVGKVTNFEETSNSMMTMYKFKLLEKLSTPLDGAGCYECLAWVNPPNELIPVKEDEFIVPMPGGTMILDGVKVINKSKDFPEFSLGQKYLLFITLDFGRSVGMLQLGPAGVFRINSDDNIESINEWLHPLRKSLEVEHGKSLRRLKDTLKNRQGSRQ
ncbi:MAG TPA: hypothetical protein VF528_12545 [Pyrinomonadaceae bacterium]|jgi:hypothetical protein